MPGSFTTGMSDQVRGSVSGAGKSISTSHPGQLSLASPPWVGAMITSQRTAMPCSWGVKAGMVHEWMAGNTVWMSPCYHSLSALAMGSFHNRALRLLYLLYYFTVIMLFSYCRPFTHAAVVIHLVLSVCPSVHLYVLLFLLTSESLGLEALFLVTCEIKDWNNLKIISK